MLKFSLTKKLVPYELKILVVKDSLANYLILNSYTLCFIIYFDFKLIYFMFYYLFCTIVSQKKTKAMFNNQLIFFLFSPFLTKYLTFF